MKRNIAFKILRLELMCRRFPTNECDPTPEGSAVVRVGMKLREGSGGAV
jgi:hypothetical protein